MIDRTVALTGIVVVLVATSAGLGAALETGSLELEAADEDDTDSTTLTFSFTATANGTADLSPTTETWGSDVSAEFTGWSSDGGASGSASSWEVTAGESYTVEYEFEASTGAREDTYDFTPTVYGPGDTHSEQLQVDLAVLEPAFSPVDDGSGDVVFTDESTESDEVEVSFTNDGDGEMHDVQADTSFVPSGMSVDVSTPDQVGAGSQGTVTISVTVEDTVGEGEHSFTVDLADSLGNQESFSVDIQVTKAPSLNVDDDTVDFGDVLVGSSASTEIVLSETGGHAPVDGIDRTDDWNEVHGDLSMPGVEDTYLSPGGSTGQTVSITVDEDAPQHEDLSWETNLDPTDPPGDGSSVSIEGRVIYPPYYESVTAEDVEITFDEPRSERSQFTESVPVTIENGGDRPMDITGISPTVTGETITATVADAPETVPAQSTATAEIALTADASAPRGEEQLDVTVDATEPGQTSTSATVGIDHETELTVDDEQLEFGRVVATRTVTQSTVVGERLGYQDVENLSIERVSGPENGWLTVTERPDSLAAGSSGPFVSSITFDTRAQFFTEYTWEYRLDGDNTEPQTITITATPRPVDFTSTVEDLRQYEDASDQRATVATETANAMEDLATILREDSSQSARGDVTTVSAAGRSTTLFLQYTSDARTQMDEGEYRSAQRSLTRSAATFNTMVDTSQRVSEPAIQRRMNTAVEAAREILNALLAEQRDHYRQQLDSEETSLLDQAQTYRQLARLAELAGDSSEAASLRNQSQQSFEEYSTLVRDGNANVQQAREDRANLTSGPMTTVAGQPVFWIGNLDRVEDRSRSINESYAEARQQFRAAGATSRAETARAEQVAFTARLERARLLSFGVAGLLGIVFLLVLAIETRAVYRYVQESRAAVSGDFLLTRETS